MSILCAKVLVFEAVPVISTPLYLRVKQHKLKFKIAIICIYLLNTYK